jgi:hypothetical protein
MTKNCLNCNSETHGQFCSNCGQSTKSHKINLHYLIHDIQHGIIHFDKGILFTAKELFTRPANTIREFINGKRVNHIKPVSLVILLSGVYALLSHFFHFDLLPNNYEIKASGIGSAAFIASVHELKDWFTQHYYVLALLQIPIYSIGTFVMFKEEGFNYIEHLVINSFITAQKLILLILTFPIIYWLKMTSNSSFFEQFIDVICYLIAFFTIFQLFNGSKIFKRTGKTLLSLIIPSLIFILLFFVILAVIIYYLS